MGLKFIKIADWVYKPPVGYYSNPLRNAFNNIGPGCTNITGVQLSDICRLDELFYWGGVYSDFDTLWLKPVESIDLDFETSLCYYSGNGAHYNQSNIISEPGGRFIKDILSLQTTVNPPYDYQAFNTQLLNAHFPPELVRKKYPRVRFIGYKLFYPYCIYSLEDLYLKNIPVSEEAIAVHWFNAHKMSKDYINKEDYSRDCSMTELLINEGYIERTMQGHGVISKGINIS